jgi:hypothetical protein
MADDAIRFQAQVFKFQTLIDGGWRLTLDGSGQKEAVIQLLDAKQPGVLLEVAAVAITREPIAPIAKVNDRQNIKHSSPYSKTKAQA